MHDLPSLYVSSKLPNKSIISLCRCLRATEADSKTLGGTGGVDEGAGPIALDGRDGRDGRDGGVSIAGCGDAITGMGRDWLDEGRDNDGAGRIWSCVDEGSGDDARLKGRLVLGGCG